MKTGANGVQAYTRKPLRVPTVKLLPHDRPAYAQRPRWKARAYVASLLNDAQSS
jgi:hypothetical protein